VAGQQARALGDGFVHALLEQPGRCLVDHRAHLGQRITGSPNFQACVLSTTSLGEGGGHLRCTSMRLTAVQRWPLFL
jgi:hypothetical protein